MGKYAPPYEITNKMLDYVASISEKVGRVSERSGLTSRPHLRRNNRIRSIYSSLRIEANSLSLGEVRDVIDGKLVLGEAREIQEVKNAYSAYEQLPVLDPYRLEEMQRIHEIMTRYLIEESGVFRSGEEGVFNGNECIFMAPPAKYVPQLMQSLFEWMNSNKNIAHPLILSAIFHYEFVFIHPFPDGNGRMARLWHTAILAKWKPVFEYLPIENQIEKFQDGYYQAIMQCHADGSSNRFIEFMLEQIDAILNELLAQTGRTGAEVSQYVQKLLAVMENGTPYTACELLKLLSLKSRESLRRNYLNPALAHGLIKMTLPESPTSRNQRYLKE